MHPSNRRHGLQQQLGQKLTFLHLQGHNLKQQQPKDGYESLGKLQQFRCNVFFKHLQLLPWNLEFDDGLQAHLWGKQPPKQQTHARLKRHFPLVNIFIYTNILSDWQVQKFKTLLASCVNDNDDKCFDEFMGLRLSTILLFPNLSW